MIYEFLVDGFEEIEALTPIDVLRRCNVDIKTVGVSSDVVVGSHNISVKADILIDDVELSNADMIILPGGPGHEEFLKSEKLLKIIDYAAKNNIYIASICAAPSIIGRLGYLAGKCATCFPGYEKYLKGATVKTEKTVVDGKFITARGAGAASEFAFEIAKIMVGEEKACEIRKSMQY